MNNEVKQKWLTALRSGEYKQCKGALCRTDFEGNLGYCCLGVLTDIYIKETNKTWIKAMDSILGIKDINDRLEAAWLNEDVQEWSGLLASPTVDGVKLALLNDNLHPFTEIADLIENHL